MMTRRSGPWTVLRYMLALPALGLLVLAFAEPRVLVAQGPKPGESAAVKADSKKAPADETKVVVIDKKKLEAEYNVSQAPDFPGPA